MNKSTIHIFRKIKRTGIEIKTKNKKYSLNYPFYIWNKFPKSLHRLFADNATYVATWHLPLVEKSKIIYHFSHPPIETIFFKMLLYTIPMNIFEARTLKTSELIKNFYNANLRTLTKESWQIGFIISLMKKLFFSLYQSVGYVKLLVYIGDGI